MNNLLLHYLRNQFYSEDILNILSYCKTNDKIEFNYNYTKPFDTEIYTEYGEVGMWDLLEFIYILNN